MKGQGRMSASILGRCVLGICAATVILAGCSGSASPITAPGTMPQSLASGPRAAHGRSWMLPEATSEDLMYVSNGNGTVTVYSYPQGNMVGTLLGFDIPMGECADAAGDVFITVYDLAKIFEYAHGGTKPMAKLSGTEYPSSCSVDPTSGNLAVDTTAFGGPVSIYAHAKGSPKIYDIVIQAP